MIQVEGEKGLPGDQFLVLNKNTRNRNKKQQNHGKMKRRPRRKHPDTKGKPPPRGNDYRDFVPDKDNPDTAKSQDFLSKFVQQNYNRLG